MNGIRRALLLTTGERYFALVVNFATLATVSRLLTPSEIGISVIGMAITAMALSIREFATTNFIIQRKDLKQEDVRATFTILLLFSAGISTLIAVSAVEIATIYGEPGLAPFLSVVSICILIEVIGAPIAALLRREMAFGRLAVINVAGAALNAGSIVTFAALDFGYMSFAWAYLLSQTLVASLSLVIWPDRSIFKPSLRSWRGIVSFGGYHGMNVTLHRIFDSLPYVVLGRILSADAVAFYNRGITICQMPDKMLLGGLGSVLLSAFSEEVRNGRELREHYLRSVELITGVLWPALVLLAILAEPIVRLLLGDQWLGSVPIVRILAIAFLFSFSDWLNYPVLLAVGAMREILIRSIIVWPISAVVITSAAFFGLEAAAFSWLIIGPFQAYVSIYFVRRHVNVRWQEIMSTLTKAATVSLCSAIGPVIVVLLAGGSDLSIPAAAIAVMFGAIGWGAGLLITRHSLLQEFKHAWTVLPVLNLAERASPHNTRLLNKSVLTKHR